MSAKTTEQMPSAVDRAIIQAFAKLDRAALGVAIGSLAGVIVFLATLILVIKGGDQVGPNLLLLGQFFIGYSVTTLGAFVGLAYGFIAGFVFGWLIAFLRNAILDAYLFVVKARAGLSTYMDSLD